MRQPSRHRFTLAAVLAIARVASGDRNIPSRVPQFTRLSR
jgi:hypothetical protein